MSSPSFFVVTAADWEFVVKVITLTPFFTVLWYSLLRDQDEWERRIRRFFRRRRLRAIRQGRAP